MLSPLSLCILTHSDTLADALTRLLSRDRYTLDFVGSQQDLVHFIAHQQRQIDCLVLEFSIETGQLLDQLQALKTLLPLIVLEPPDSSHATAINHTHSSPSSAKTAPGSSNCLGTLQLAYHAATVWVSKAELEQVEEYIHQAIEQFLRLPASQLLPEQELATGASRQTSLVLQQRRLATKLKERLGYLGVYYKRNPQYFFRNMSQDERQEFLENANLKYREIILSYFSNDETLNQKIDEYVNTAFFADVSVSQIVEIHMELMDEFSKQLQLEGRSEDILLDYRLTLIDVIAHLCEMYRRSIPREA